MYIRHLWKKRDLLSSCLPIIRADNSSFVGYRANEMNIYHWSHPMSSVGVKDTWCFMYYLISLCITWKNSRISGIILPVYSFYYIHLITVQYHRVRPNKQPTLLGACKEESFFVWLLHRHIMLLYAYGLHVTPLHGFKLLLQLANVFITTC